MHQLKAYRLSIRQKVPIYAGVNFQFKERMIQEKTKGGEIVAL